MAKKIKIEFKIPNWKDVLSLLKNKIKKLFSRVLLFFKKAFNVFLGDIKNKKWQGLIVLILSFGAFFLWNLSSALLWLLFLLFLVYGWENRIIAFLALISLTSCPFLLMFKKDDTAEIMAVYAYFFLVMTVVLQIIEYRRDLKNEKE